MVNLLLKVHSRSLFSRGEDVTSLRKRGGVKRAGDTELWQRPVHFKRITSLPLEATKFLESGET